MKKESRISGFRADAAPYPDKAGGSRIVPVRSENAVSFPTQQIASPLQHPYYTTQRAVFQECFRGHFHKVF